MLLIEAPELSINSGEKVALVGPSGSGKSQLAKRLIGIPKPSPSIFYKGRSLSNLNETEIRVLRRNEVAFVPQEFDLSLTPTLKIGNQLLESTVNNEGKTRDLIDLLHTLCIKEPDITMQQYPFQLSGGMQQRILIAMALLRHPELIILDEPTSALDEKTAYAVLSEIKKRVSSILLITHDLKLASTFTDRSICLS